MLRAKLCEAVLHRVFGYLEPWTVRHVRTTCRSLHGLDHDRLIATTDAFYLNRINPARYTKRPCHGIDMIYRKNDARLVDPHECDLTAGCEGWIMGARCHRTNRFARLRWMIEHPHRLPYKCTVCGRIYLDLSTAESMYHVTTGELSKLDSSFYRASHTLLFRLRDVQWLALVINGRIDPTYRFSNRARTKREQWFQRYAVPRLIALEQNYDGFVSSAALLRTRPFVRFREHSSCTLRELHALLTNFETVLPAFRQLHDMLQSPGLASVRFFPDMHTYAIEPGGYDASGYRDVLHRSIEHCIAIAAENPQNQTYALQRARSQAFRVLQRTRRGLIGTDVPRNEHHAAYQDFLRGERTLEDLSDFVEHQNTRKERRAYLTGHFENRGLNLRVIRCNAVERYLEHGPSESNTLEGIMTCVLRHVTIPDRLTDTAHCSS